MVVRSQDRRTVQAFILERYLETYQRDGWKCAGPRGDGYAVIYKQFQGSYRLLWALERFAERGITARVIEGPKRTIS